MVRTGGADDFILKGLQGVQIHVSINLQKEKRQRESHSSTLIKAGEEPLDKKACLLELYLINLLI